MQRSSDEPAGSQTSGARANADRRSVWQSVNTAHSWVMSQTLSFRTLYKRVRLRDSKEPRAALEGPAI